MVTYDQQNLDTTSLIICSPFNKPLICYKIISRFCPGLSQNATCKHFHNFIQVYFQQIKRPITDYPCSQWLSLYHRPFSQPDTKLSLPSHPPHPCPLPRPVNQLSWSLPLKYVYTSLYPYRP